MEWELKKIRMLTKTRALRYIALHYITLHYCVTGFRWFKLVVKLFIQFF